MVEPSGRAVARVLDGDERVTDWTVRLDVPGRERGNTTLFERVALPPHPCSINDEVEALPRRATRGYDRGRLLMLPRMGLIVVPYQDNPGGYWSCVVVHGNSTYPQGGYDISVSDAEIRKGIEIPLQVERDDVGDGHG